MYPAGRMCPVLARRVNVGGNVGTGRRSVREILRHDESQAHRLSCEFSRLDAIVEDYAVAAVGELDGLEA